MTIFTANPHLLSTLASFICFIITVICLLTSIKIMRRYRHKQVFIILICGLGTAAIPQLLNAYAASSLQAVPESLYIISTIAGTISFIIINFVFMKMYAIGIRIRIAPIVLLSLGAAIAIAASFLLAPYEIGGTKALGFPVLDFYMFILIITMLVVTRHIEMPAAYFISLCIMFSYQIALMLHQYVFEHSQPWLGALVMALPVLYYFLLFYLLLEWIMERLLTTYQSAILDGLTGLYVRRHFQKKLAEMIARKPAAVIFCDIDNFKSLNDAKGHHAADQALQQVASILRDEVAPHGIAGRYGGEELLGAIEIDKVKPQTIAERIRARVEQETIVTVSVGFCTTKESAELASLVKLADEAMYYSKSTGKNKVTSYRSIPAAYKNKA